MPGGKVQIALCDRRFEIMSKGIENIPQRLHSVCVLLWRFPKEEVPFAVVVHQYLLMAISRVLRSQRLKDVLILDQGICWDVLAMITSQIWKIRLPILYCAWGVVDVVAGFVVGR